MLVNYKFLSKTKHSIQTKRDAIYYIIKVAKIQNLDAILYLIISYHFCIFADLLHKKNGRRD